MSSRTLLVQHGWIIPLVILGLLAAPQPVRAQGRKVIPTDAQVDKLIQELQEAIFSHQVDEWAVIKGVKEKDGSVGPLDLGADKSTKVEMYKSVTTTETGYECTDAAGKVTKYDKGEVFYLQPPGHFQPDYYTRWNPGGYTTMAVWGLVASDFPVEDPRMEKALKSYFEGTCAHGTYTLSFRLNILSHLIRWRDPRVTAGYKKYLSREADTLIKAAGENGQYTYQAYPPRGYVESPADSWTWKGKSPGGGSDNSNTQFGPFGISAAEDALVEVDPTFWLKQQEWWESGQRPDGHWSYKVKAEEKERIESDVNMTDAGMNSLYLVIDNYYSRQAGKGYIPLKGFTYTPEAYTKMQRLFAALHRGFAWMESPAGKHEGGHGLYYDYGLQRLGLNCGRKYIGPRFWYEKVVEDAYEGGLVQGKRKKGGGETLSQDAWRLMCLAFGRAPVLFNKLDTGDETDWDYYVRDVDHLTDWIGLQLEKRVNWQIVETKHTLHDFQDAPIMIISGKKKLELSEDALRKLKDYCDFGGTIVLNPTHDSKEFKDSARELFTKLYAKEGYEFSEVAANHPIYVGAQGKEAKSNATVPRNKVPLSGMSDGGRTFLFLVNGDIAGAWQLLLYKTQREMFTIMLNLRLYAAPLYNDLPGRLRPKLPNLGPGPNKVVVARLKHSGHGSANARLYEALGFTMSTQGYGLEVREDVVPDDAALKGVHVIHITGHNSFSYKPSEVAAIKKALEGGAFLLIDPAYGRKEFLDSAETLVQQLGLAEEAVTPQEHPLFKDAEPLKPNRWLAGGLLRAFKELRLNNKPVGLLATVDITAAACGQYVFGNPGIGIDAARKLWVNVAAAGSKITPVTVAIPGVPQAPTPTPKPASQASGDK